MNRKQNTEAFQIEFSNAYKVFFGKCKTVISTDCTFWVTWGAGWREGSPIVVQKAPYKLYVGIEAIEQNTLVEQGDSVAYHTLTQTFSSTEDSLISWKKFIPLFIELIKNKTQSKRFDGIRIHLLSEQPFYTADSPDVFMAVVCALYNHFGFVDAKTMRTLAMLPGKELFSLKNADAELFREMHRSAMRLIEAATGGRACGDEAYASFIHSETPLIYSVDVIDENEHFMGLSLQELANVQGVFPFDVVSIDVGQSFFWPNSEYNFGATIRQSLGELQMRTNKLFDPTKMGSEIPRFVEESKVVDCYWKLFCKSSLLKSIHFLDCFIALYRQPTRSSAVTECLESLDSMSTISAPFEEMPSSHMQHIVRRLKDVAERIGVPIACLYVCSGKTEGNIMVFMKKHALRKEMIEEITRLKGEYSPNIATGFVSWRDGWGSGEGCKVEQSEREGIFSLHLHSSLKMIYSREDGSSSSVSIEQGNIDPSVADVVIDSINHEIYVDGKTVNSKVLPTKKATIDLFKVLFENSSHSVLSKDLKRSTYTSSRNDMQGKIIGPLVRLVEDTLHKKLSLKVEGELISFFVVWKPGGVSLALITKY